MKTMTETERLKEIVVKLRSEDGCPWDRVQTHASLNPEKQGREWQDEYLKKAFAESEELIAVAKKRKWGETE